MAMLNSILSFEFKLALCNLFVLFQVQYSWEEAVRKETFLKEHKWCLCRCTNGVYAIADRPTCESQGNLLRSPFVT